MELIIKKKKYSALNQQDSKTKNLGPNHTQPCPPINLSKASKSSTTPNQTHRCQVIQTPFDTLGHLFPFSAGLGARVHGGTAPLADLLDLSLQLFALEEDDEDGLEHLLSLPDICSFFSVCFTFLKRDTNMS